MVTNEELEGFRRDRYFARSWALLTRDKGWIKPVLVMTVAMFVPIVGPLGCLGYVLEWARLTAWGVNSSPKQKDVGVGKCIGSGWRAFVVLLVWGVCSTLIGFVLGEVPLVGGLLSFVWMVFSLFVGLLEMVAALRATIYQKIAPGLRVKRVWEMGSHDAVGLLKVLLIQVVANLIVGAVALLATVALLSIYLPSILYFLEYVGYYGASDSLINEFIVSFISQLGPVIVVALLLASFASVLISMITYTAVGLWMRQFDVPAWGADKDPLPPFVNDPRDVHAYGSAAQQPGSQQAGPQQPGPEQAWQPNSAPFNADYQRGYQEGWQRGYDEARRQTPPPGPAPDHRPPYGGPQTPPPAGPGPMRHPAAQPQDVEVEVINVEDTEDVVDVEAEYVGGDESEVVVTPEPEVAAEPEPAAEPEAPAEPEVPADQQD